MALTPIREPASLDTDTASKSGHNCDRVSLPTHSQEGAQSQERACLTSERLDMLTPRLDGITPILPSWIRSAGHVQDNRAGNTDLGDQEFRTGGALAFVGIAVEARAAHEGCWLDRLALRAAAVSVALEGRTEDEAALRDAWHLTKPGQDPGPAGRVFALWRQMAGQPSLLTKPEALVATIQHLGFRESRLLLEVVHLARDLAERTLSPLAAITDIIAVGQSRCPGLPALPLLLADIILAERLRWPTVVPLLAIGLGGHPFRSPLSDWPTVCLPALRRGCITAWTLHKEIGRRAETLLAVKGRLRSKMSGGVVERLLTTDALSPARLPGTGSDRAGRRLFDRLVTLGAVRELTGRTSFRLYGL